MNQQQQQRKDIPNFIGKYVLLNGFTEREELNGKIGFVNDWHEDSKCFIIKMSETEMVELVKPFFLQFFDFYTNCTQARELCLALHDYELYNFEKSLKRFENLCPIEKYEHTHLKLQWLQHMIKHICVNDKRCVPKVQNALIDIMESSKFEDLVVDAKLLLCNIIAWFDTKRENFDESRICLDSIDAHFGRLPDLYFYIACNLLKREYEEKDYQIVFDVFHDSQKMIAEKNCQNFGIKRFLKISLTFLDNCQKFNFFDEEKLFEQLYNLRKILNKSNFPLGEYYFLSAWINFFSRNFEEAIKDAENFEKSSGKNFVSYDADILKLQCYIHLKNKTMATKFLKIVKNYNIVGQEEERIYYLEQEIENMDV